MFLLHLHLLVCVCVIVRHVLSNRQQQADSLLQHSSHTRSNMFMFSHPNPSELLTNQPTTGIIKEYHHEYSFEITLAAKRKKKISIYE